MKKKRLLRNKPKKEDITKFTAKKSKAAAKQGRGKYQFEIMMQLGLSKEEVAAFADPQHWLEHFPPLVQKDVTAFGGRVDWRRSMVTTPAKLTMTRLCAGRLTA